MTDYILCLLGIFVYFLSRYNNRKRKTKLSIGFWFRENWQEFVSTLALNLALMILIHLPETSVDLESFLSTLPIGLHLAGVPALSFLLGLGLTATFYSMFKAKTK